MRWLVIGRKGAGTVRFRGFSVEQAWTGFTDRPTYQDAEAIAHRVIELFAAGEVDKVVMVYNAFRSALVQEIAADTLLPLAAPEIREKSRARDRDGGPAAVRAGGRGDAGHAAAHGGGDRRSTARCSNRPPPSTARG